MRKNVVLLDGAVGTSLWEKTENKVPVWRYNIENPDIVTELHREYIDAGCQIILANTFGANGAAVSKSPYTVEAVVTKGVKLAKEAAQGRAKVALSVGPLTGLLEPYGEITEDEAAAFYQEQIGSGMEERPDLILIQTFMDIEMMKIAVKTANQYGVPVFCAMSFEKSGRTMMGNSVRDMLDGLKSCRVDAVGLNCSLGPDLALPIMKEFKENTSLPLLFKPNAGKPRVVDGKTEVGLDIETFVEDTLPAVDLGVTYIGGCCGTNPAYMKRLGEKLRAI